MYNGEQSNQETTGIKDERYGNHSSLKRWPTREALNKNAIITYSFMIFDNPLHLQTQCVHFFIMFICNVPHRMLK